MFLSPSAEARSNSPLVTLLIRAPSEVVSDELRIVVASAFAVLRNAVEDPTVFPGGGCFEIMLAAHLRRRAQLCLDSQSNKRQSFLVPDSGQNSAGFSLEGLNEDLEERFRRTSQIYRAVWEVADCLEQCAAALRQDDQGEFSTKGPEWKTRILGKNKRSLKQEMLQGRNSLSTFHGFHSNHISPKVVLSTKTDAKGQRVFCHSSSQMCSCGLSSHTVLDSAQIKRRGIQAAIEAASAALRVGISVKSE